MIKEKNYKKNERERICMSKITNLREKTLMNRGITLIALVITIIFSYDEKLKCSNSKGFLLTTI